MARPALHSCVRRALVIGLVALLALAANAHALGWSLINAKIRHDFPQVQRITTAELAAWLNDERRPAPLLLDVRTSEEFEVSHLRAAIHVAPGAPASLIAEPKDRPIVTYCSVGYRSGAFAEKLQAAGYTNVANLEGSIFRWANEGRPVYRGAAQVAKVHPYNGTWGLLLKKKLRAAD
jgi:rhodanese-related sulfurtransferase